MPDFTKKELLQLLKDNPDLDKRVAEVYDRIIDLMIETQSEDDAEKIALALVYDNMMQQANNIEELMNHDCDNCPNVGNCDAEEGIRKAQAEILKSRNPKPDLKIVH